MDRSRLYRILIISLTAITLGWCQSDGSEQLQVPVGAYRVFPKTSFSCVGRPAGYYADIETGCQVYHMCDGLGRQFSYSCPNTTLFQQRMLICDHWYMVNCSRAERDYAANLLIGQRDKPFVPEEENQLRTPRPDLLDRPYAPDYSGESFRNQYKQLPLIQNEIIDYNAEKFHKPTPTRWHINRPSSVILPPSQPPVINRRMDEVDDGTTVDLGTSFSSNYNSSGDITASAEERVPEKSPDSNIIVPSIKPPSKLYEPPFLYPIWNENYTAEEESTSTVPTTMTTIPLFNRPSTIGGRPFSQALPTTTTFVPPTQQSTISTDKTQGETTPPRKTTHNDYDFSKYSTRQTTEREDRTESTLGTTSTTEISITTPSTQNPIEADFGIPRKDFLLPPAPFSKSEDSEIAKPSLLILPPFAEYASHDIATTQGPPIYYEWKIPSNALEPPKLDSPIGGSGRKEDEYPPEPNDSLSTATSFVDNTAENQPRPFSHNPFLAPIVNKSQRSVTAKTATARSIQQPHGSQTTLPNSLTLETKETNKTSSSKTPSSNVDFEKLKKDWSVPDFLFPLENDARTGYEHSDIFNSFQVKIPERRSEDSKRWYGENADCPECHPSFVKPGTCEPCVRRR